MPAGCILRAKVWTNLPSHFLAGMNLRNRGPVAHIMATILILSFSRKERKSDNLVYMKTKTLSLVLIPLLAYFSASSTSQAVTPPPDGGCSGGNTAEGQNALLSLTAGVNNTAVGWFSLRSNTDGQLNTGVSSGTLFSTGHASRNTAIGVNRRHTRF